jgi:hypothetical protein
VAQKIKVNEALYVVASSVDNTGHGAGGAFASQAAAQDFMRAEIGRSPALGGTLHVIPVAEMQEVA